MDPEPGPAGDPAPEPFPDHATGDVGGAGLPLLRGGDRAPTTLAASSPTRCQVRNRLWRDGALVGEGLAVEDLRGHFEDERALVWMDLLDPDEDDLAVLSKALGLHPLAVEDAVHEHQRPKLDHYRTHSFLSAYGVRLDTGTGELATSEVAAFLTDRALITVRKDDQIAVGALVERFDAIDRLAAHGVGFLLQGLLDLLVDSHFAAVQSLDDELDELEDQLFADGSNDAIVQRRSFELRKSLVTLRRVVLPMREVVNTLLRRDLRYVDDTLAPYYQDIYDHVLRATEWTESLRDLVNSILDTNLTIQGNRMNTISKKVTSWAAIIAVPTFITGFAGMNLPYPGFARSGGLYAISAIMAVSCVTLYVVFKRKDWL